MLKKLSTFLSLFVILSTFLVTPVTAMAEGTTNSSEASTAITMNDSSSSSTEKVHTENQQKNQLNSNSEKDSTPISDAISNNSSVKSNQAKPRAPTLRANKDWGDKFIDHAELDDADGNPQTSFGIYDDMKAKWHYNIPAGTDINSGDTMTVDIPEVLTLAADVEFDITDAAGNVIGHAKADHNTGKVTITFTDYAEEAAKNGISGNFHISVHWDKTQVSEDTTVPVEWGNSGSTDIDINPGSGPDSNEELYKWGWYDDDPTIIHWRVRINYAKESILNAVYTDNVGGNQTLISGSVTAYHVDYNEDGSDFTVKENVPNTDIIEDSDLLFHVNLHDINDTVIIDYSTKATDGGSSSKYENNGTLTGDNIETCTVDVYTPDNGGGGDGETTVNVKGTKTWDDNDNQDGKRPGSIKVNLLSNGEVVQTKTVTADDNWAYSFTDLPKYDEDGKEIVYTITEDKVAGYETEVDGYNIINHYTPKPTPINPDNPDNPVKPDSPIKPSEPKLTPETPSKQAALPSTSAQSIIVVPLVLLVLTLTTVVLVWFQKKHN